jgi:predicted RNase H-like HicB family nuclease
MFKYSVITKWSDEDDGFIATIPELPGLSAFGITQKKAISELEVATEAYLETLKESGEELPVADKLIPYSGQIRLRMPKKLHKELAEQAELEGISLNTHMISLLSERKESRKSNEILAQVKKIVEKTYLPKLQSTIIKEQKIVRYSSSNIVPKDNPNAAIPIAFDQHINNLFETIGRKIVSNKAMDDYFKIGDTNA